MLIETKFCISSYWMTNKSSRTLDCFAQKNDIFLFLCCFYCYTIVCFRLIQEEGDEDDIVISNDLLNNEEWYNLSRWL